MSNLIPFYYRQNVATLTIRSVDLKDNGLYECYLHDYFSLSSSSDEDLLIKKDSIRLVVIKTGNCLRFFFIFNCKEVKFDNF
jgi:hypothetical protein